MILLGSSFNFVAKENNGTANGKQRKIMEQPMENEGKEWNSQRKTILLLTTDTIRQ